jgi:hypothetical protein
MSLASCHECQHQVSTDAKSCPNCGAAVKQPTSPAKIILVGFIVLVIGISITGTPTPPPAPKSPEQKAKEERENLRFNVARTVIANLKKSLRDPTSLAVESIFVNEDSTILCMEYRAKNGFGGTNKEILVLLNDRSSKKPADWNKHCTKEMYDLKWAAR